MFLFWKAGSVPIGYESPAIRFIPTLRPTVWTQLITVFFFPSMPRGMILWSAKVPKALCQSSNEPFAQSHAHQKNSSTSFCVQYFFLKN